MSEDAQESISQRYAKLRAEVPAGVGIVAVTKFQPVEAIREAIAAGVTDIGENYLQEAREKFPLLPPGVRKHFIGHVQTNKAKAIVSAFDVVQSVDRLDAGRALAKAAEALNKRLPVLVQLNISPMERFGCKPEDAEELANALRALEALQLEGVMAIGPLTADREEVAGAFDTAAQVFRRVGGTTLSIGMSDDWREAVRAGSTMIRVGTTLFGQRPAARASKSSAMSS